MFQSVVDTLAGYVEQGGFVMPPLVVATLLLWYTIGYRALALQRGTTRHVRLLIDDYKQGRTRRPRGLVDCAALRGVNIARLYPHAVTEALDDAFFTFYQDIKKGRTVILGIVSIAPLLGLLGTVTGMIETFDSLGDMSLFAQSGGIAGGISQALFSTQMGLCVAIPGVIVGRLLDRRQRRIEEELDQIKALLGGDV
jgi:biopolymer transport protein ExbB